MSLLRDAVPLTRNIEVLSSAEARTVFNLAAVGRAVVYTNVMSYEEEIVEVVIVSAGVNTVQLLAKGLPLTPAFPMAANQAYIDPGFFLFPGETIEVICGAANAVVGFIHRRVVPHVA